ncbi:MAG TPA: tetratricopeptide repeat protein [Bacteroidetes bacterium]|nr:tetratricopeptide repeat protein [Bacteroidota bacterium]
MASLIEGYEYDIFISYRQKDNKYDGWVTEFVKNLQRELDATFKEDISIYFDENPYDGLLEIHNVDKSLESKLKSVVFIPVISQTYCDPKSFAWQNEFVAFNKTAGEDQYGRDIKLPNGNVCSRIVPVKIHDLDPTDTELVEKELGCRLRSIDFIFSSAGVNRPLTPYDNPDKNLNRTYYRDQINKVANAVKEIIYGLHPNEKKRITKSYQTRAQAGFGDETTRPVKINSERSKWLSGRIIAPVAIGLLAILAIVFIIPKLLPGAGKNIPSGETINKSIAVMPVSNFTGDPGMGWIADMIQSDLTGQLQGISNLIVRPKQTTLQFRNSEETVQEIARKLSVNSLVETSIKGTEDELQVEIMVLEAFPEEKYLYRSSFTRSFTELANIYSELVNRILKEMDVKPTDEEEETLAARIVNPQVRKACARGAYYMNQLTLEGFDKGVKYYEEAIAIDPADPEPYIGLALGYGSAGHGAGLASLEMAKAYALKAIELDPEELHPNLADAHVVLAETYLYHDYDFLKAEHHLKRAIDLNPNSAPAHYTYGWYLALSNLVDEAADEMKKAMQIDPLAPICPGYLAWMLQWFGRYEEAIGYAEEALEVNPNYPMAYYVLGMVYAELGRYEEAIDTLKKIYSPTSGFASGLGVAYALSGQTDGALEIAAEMEAQNMRWHTWGLADIYAALGDKDKAIYWLEEAYKLRHDFIPWVRNNPYYNILADDSRFRNLVDSLNLPEITEL